MSATAYFGFAIFNFVIILVFGLSYLKRTQTKDIGLFHVVFAAVITGVLSFFATILCVLAGVSAIILHLSEKYKDNPWSVNDKYKDI